MMLLAGAMGLDWSLEVFERSKNFLQCFGYK